MLIGKQFAMVMPTQISSFNKNLRIITTTAFMPWLLIVFIVATSSCIEEITGFKDEPTGINVLNSLACADSTIDVYIGKTSDIFEPKYRSDILPESVSLFINDTITDRLNHLGDLKYSGQYLIKPKDKLRLEALFNDGEVLHAYDSVPGRVEIITAEYMYPAYKSEYGTVYGKIKLTFQDPPDSKNYYEILFLRDLRYIQTYKIQNSFISIDFENDPNPPNTILFNDELINGKLVTLEIYVSSQVTPTIILRNCSKNYFEYMNSINIHFSTQNTSRSNVYDFFKGDPVELFSNIHGGLGIFASYTDFTEECILIDQDE